LPVAVDPVAMLVAGQTMPIERFQLHSELRAGSPGALHGPGRSVAELCAARARHSSASRA
jgi:hypothetical protein